MSAEPHADGEVQFPLCNLQYALQGQMPYIRDETARQLHGRDPYEVFGDPEFEVEGRLVAAVTNGIVAKVAAEKMRVYEPTTAYDTFLWSRYLAAQVLGHAPHMEAGDFAEAYEGLPKEELVAISDAYFKERLPLKTLANWCISQIDLSGQFSLSAQVVAGLSFKLIEEREASTLAASVEEFVDELGELSSEEFIARLLAADENPREQQKPPW